MVRLSTLSAFTAVVIFVRISDLLLLVTVLASFDERTSMFYKKVFFVTTLTLVVEAISKSKNRDNICHVKFYYGMSKLLTSVTNPGLVNREFNRRLRNAF